ncbi:MAG: hypothetical protein AB7L65_00565 [Hyphomonadaceae bacterium]
MTNADDEAEPIPTYVAAQSETRGSGWIVTWAVRALARFWVVCLLLLAAAFGGISVFQYMQMKAQLNELRAAPGAQSYAVVAYRRELARQVHAYSRDWDDLEVLPTPPARPRLLEEIDLARQRNAEIRRSATRAPARGQPIGAPP